MENEQNEQKILKSVKGNPLSLAIPLQKVTFTPNGKVTEDYYPAEGSVVEVMLLGAYQRFTYEPVVEGNMVRITDKGTLPVGEYAVVTTVTEPDGTPRRSKWCNIVRIYDCTDAVLEEYEDFPEYGESEVLDGTVFIFAKGDPFTYDDFTEEQLADLKRPAEEAAATARLAAGVANQASREARGAAQDATDAASAANGAAADAQQAAAAANTAATNANEAADSAEEAAIIGGHPDYVGEDNYVYKYNMREDRYERTNIYVKGDKGDAGTTDYNLLENKPTRVSQFANDADYATESFVNSSIATATATYRGSYNLVTDLGLSVGASAADVSTALATSISDADNNDYCFVQIPVATDTPTVIARIDRYKHNGSGWLYEYTLNNSGFTAEQWDAINSGITSGDVDKLDALPTSAQLTSLLNGKQDTINDLGTIRSGASAGATAYQKPQAGIPESDLSQGVKDKMNEKEVSNNKVSSWQDTPDNTHYPSEKLVKESLDAIDKLVEVEYGVTTVAEINDILAAGKTPYVKVVHQSLSYTALLSTNTSVRFAFCAINREQSFSVELTKANETWSIYGVISLERAANKKNTIVGLETSTVAFPTTKAVADYVHQETAKWGVVSQTLNVIIVRDPVVQTDNFGHNIEVTDPVEGWISQANIDLFENAGAVFNSSTGYFELNGITNIAYDEMQRIYTTGDIWRYYTSGDMNISSANYDIGIYRTVFPTCCFKTIATSFVRSTCNLEVIKFSRTPFIYANNGAVSYAFYNNNNALKKVLDRIDCQAGTAFNLDNCFTGCPLLETIYINKLQKNIGFKLNYKLSYKTVSYMVSHATNTSAITITVHPTIYGYLTGTIQPPEETGGTSAEWQQIVTDATAKNISFASA